MTSRHVLGVRIDDLTLEETRSRIRDFLLGTAHATIFTPNPEMAVEAFQDEAFRDVLNRGTLNVCDGTGLRWASGFLSKQAMVERIHGIDLMLDVCDIASQLNKSVYLLGSDTDDILKKTKDVLEARFPHLRIVGAHPGLRISVRRDPASAISYSGDDNERIIDDIIDVAPDVLFVAFGHHKQERWIDDCLPELPSVKIAMGVGGSFDVLSGKLSRAPKTFRKLGLEWFWRLILQPWRLKRIFRATIVFPYLVLKEKWS